MGFGYLIVANSLSKKVINNLFTFTIILALLIFLLINLSRFWIVDLSNVRSAVNIVSILAISMFFNIANIVPAAILLKNEKYKYISLITIITEIISTSIIYAVSFKYISTEVLAIKYVISSFLIFIISIYILEIKIKFKLRFDFNIKNLKYYFKPNLYTTGFNSLNYFNRSLDNILVVNYIGASALGFYDKAYTLMQYPIQAFSSIIEKTLLPSLSAAGNLKNKEIIDIHNNLVNKLSIYGIITSIFVYSTSTYLVLLLYGEQWIGVVGILKVFCISIPIQCLMHTSSSFYYYYGEYKMLFYTGLTSLLSMVPLIIVGVYSNNLLILSAWIVVGLHITFFNVYYILYKKIFKTSFLEFMKNCKYIIIYELILTLIIYNEI